MKISKVTPLVMGAPWREMLFVKVETDEGLVGVGEADVDELGRDLREADGARVRGHRALGAVAVAEPVGHEDVAAGDRLGAEQRAEVQGLPAFPSLAAMPGPIDLAMIGLPAAAVPDAVEACIARNVLSIVIFSAGFAETGAAGMAAQDRLRRRCAEA
ncbi:hypothetical protein B4Q13_21475, partial [Lacticaseibacillus rhamnosus]